MKERLGIERKLLVLGEAVTCLFGCWMVGVVWVVQKEVVLGVGGVLVVENWNL